MEGEGPGDDDERPVLAEVPRVDGGGSAWEGQGGGERGGIE